MNKCIKIMTVAFLGLAYFSVNAASSDQSSKSINDCIGAVNGDCVAGNIQMSGGKMGGSREINWCVGAVTGDCVGGNVSIGSASDKISISEDGILVQNLGVIKKNTVTDLSLLLSGKKIIAFTPTEGDYSNRQFKLLAVALDLNNIPATGITTTLFPHAQDIKDKNPQVETLFNLYRKFPDEALWSPLLISVQMNSFASIKPKFEISPQGSVTYFPSQQVKDGVPTSSKPIVFTTANAS